MFKRVERPSSSVATIIWLASRDLVHEHILTFCLITALSAVMLPLLVIQGLKTGVMDILYHQLIQDPAFREIKPGKTFHLDQQWFAKLQARPEVAFAIPTILQGASIISAKVRGAQLFHSLDLLPTAPGDVLLAHSGVAVPQPGEAVLTHTAAMALNVKRGDRIQVRVSRRRHQRFEFEVSEFIIIGILAEKVDPLQRIYTPLVFTTDVERYREGRAVPERNWPGSIPSPAFSYDGAWIITSTPLPRLTALSLTVGTGFTEFSSMSPEQFASRTGLQIPADYLVYDVHTLMQAVSVQSIQNVRNVLRGHEIAVLPYIRAASLHLRPTNSSNPPSVKDTLQPQSQLPVLGLSPSAYERHVLQLPELPWEPIQRHANFPRYAQLLLPDQHPLAHQTELMVRLDTPSNLPWVPVQVGVQQFSPFALVPIELLGALRTGLDQLIVYEPQQQQLLLARTGYSGFRLYAQTIFDVAPLAEWLNNANGGGLDSILTSAQAIGRLLVLDRGLNVLFWVVAVIGISGGLAVLTASLYASVERKQRDLAVLRLAGLTRKEVAQFPMIQSFTIACIVLGLSFLGFWMIAQLINLLFVDYLAELTQVKADLCHLELKHSLIAISLVLFVALFGALLAAQQTMRIEISEAIRVE